MEWDWLDSWALYLRIEKYLLTNHFSVRSEGAPLYERETIRILARTRYADTDEYCGMKTIMELYKHDAWEMKEVVTKGVRGHPKKLYEVFGGLFFFRADDENMCLDEDQLDIRIPLSQPAFERMVMIFVHSDPVHERHVSVSGIGSLKKWDKKDFLGVNHFEWTISSPVLQVPST